MSIKSRLERLEQQEGVGGEFAVIHVKNGCDYEKAVTEWSQATGKLPPANTVIIRHFGDEEVNAVTGI